MNDDNNNNEKNKIPGVFDVCVFGLRGFGYMCLG